LAFDDNIYELRRQKLKQIEALGQIAELGVAMAQALTAVQDRGGAALWIAESAGVPAARFVAADHVLRLGGHGLVAARRMG